MRKSDETKKIYRRSRDRVVLEQGAWFVRTREGLRGPFQSKAAAEREADSYADTMDYLKHHQATVAPDLDLSDVEIIDLDKPCWRP